jgi:hypothetical protein
MRKAGKGKGSMDGHAPIYPRFPSCGIARLP